MTTRRRLFSAVGVMTLVAVLVPGRGVAQVAMSDDSITVMGDDVLTMGHATPLYARGTGFNNAANRVVRFGNTLVVNDPCDFAAGGLHRGLKLSIFDALGHVSSTNYDTWLSAADSDALADALKVLGNGQIGLLTSCDAFEEHITANLRAQASRLGLVRLARKPGSSDPATWRHPYVAIFYGSPDGTPSHQALEILQPNAADAPHAILATWLMDDGFVGQALPEARPDPPCFNTTERFVNCGNGTVTDTVTGLIYLYDANCLGQQDWPTANQSAANLSSGQCGLSDGSRAGDWRLKTKEEWEAILRPGCAEAPRIVGNGANSDTSCYSDSSWASDVESALYWSSTTRTSSTTSAWDVIVSSGNMFWDGKTQTNYAWPVRDGGPATGAP